MKLGLLLINLDRHPERLEHMRRQLDATALPWERIPAVDGNKGGGEGYSPELNQRHFHRELSPGERACFASHRKAWQHLLYQGWDGAIILEDDIELAPDFATLAHSLATTQHHWEALKLMGFNRNRILSRTPLDATGRWEIGDYLKAPSATCAQVITATAATRLLKTTKHFGVPVDTAMQYHWRTNVIFQAILPYPVHCASSGEPSDLRGRRGTHHPFHRLKKVKQQIQYNAHAYVSAIQQHGIAALLRTQRV
ncbi:MAG: glycosyltransferase family 25 protein [Puniceicoccales bacterium]|jgi:glycosyl transferase family 25|nr:glycosyltransferase family 25 protein [Puniceicoccales bacterium]